MKLNSIKFKICVLYLVIISGWLILFRTLTYITLRHTLHKTTDQELLLKAQAISQTIQSYLNASDRNEDAFMCAVQKTLFLDNLCPEAAKTRDIEFQWMMRANKLDLNKDYILLLTLQGTPIVYTNNVRPGLIDFVTGKLKNRENDISFMTIDFKKENLFLRMISIPFFYQDYPGYILRVATSFKPATVILRQQWLYNAVLFPVVLLIAVFAAWVIVGQSLKPVVEIAKTAKSISLENLGERVKIVHPDEEMKYLADAFNGMIARLEKSFRYVNEFSTYVSHELKTPLAIIKGEAEFALHQDRNTQEYKRVLSLALEEIDRMLKIIGDLLLLARLEYKKEIIKFEVLDFTRLLADICEQTRLLASRKRINVTCHIPGKPVMIHGNSINLRRLFLNLIDNAIKFTPERGAISISSRAEQDKIITSVSDTGVGISEADMPKLFTKFFTRDAENEAEAIHGLGLHIVHHIVMIHHGDITVKSELNKGTLFTVTLPLS